MLISKFIHRVNVHQRIRPRQGKPIGPQKVLLLLLLGAGGADVQHNVLLGGIHLEEVSTLVGEVAGIAALAAGRAEGAVALAKVDALHDGDRLLIDAKVVIFW